MTLPQVVSRAEWLTARTALLSKEKAMTRQRDELNTARRRLPMVEVTKDYTFEGSDGEVGLLDLFDGRRQLMVGHFMFNPEWDDGCPSCSAGADERAPALYEHLNVRDTSLVYVSRAPLAKIENYKQRKGWTFPPPTGQERRLPLRLHGARGVQRTLHLRRHVAPRRTNREATMTEFAARKSALWRSSTPTATSVMFLMVFHRGGGA